MNHTRQEPPGLLNSRQWFGAACPSCGSGVAADANWCEACHFTGSDTMGLFPEPPPPLMPMLDAACLWNADDLKRIEAAREKLRRRFPQFHFHVCTVMLPPETKLPVFGFWLLNVCPLAAGETADDRAGTHLLLINANTGQAAVIPGYLAERCLSDHGWEKVMSSMSKAWKAGQSAAAVRRFFETSAGFLDQAWKLRGVSLPFHFLRDPGLRRFPSTHPPRRLGAPYAGGNQALVDLGPPPPGSCS